MGNDQNSPPLLLPLLLLLLLMLMLLLLLLLLLLLPLPVAMSVGSLQGIAWEDCARRRGAFRCGGSGNGAVIRLKVWYHMFLLYSCSMYSFRKGKLVPFEEKVGKRLVGEPKITSVLSYQFLNATNNLNFDCYPIPSMYSPQNTFCLGANSSFPPH